MHPAHQGLRKIEVRLVVIEGEAVGGAEMGEYLHDVLLLTGRELVLAVMVAVVFFISSLFSIRPNVVNLHLFYFQFVIFLKRAFQT